MLNGSLVCRNSDQVKSCRLFPGQVSGTFDRFDLKVQRRIQEV
jgi:hypothetical protein